MITPTQTTILELYKYNYKYVNNSGYEEIYANNNSSIKVVEDVITNTHHIIDVFENGLKNNNGAQLNIPYVEYAFEEVYKK